jgi:tetratricopeptide (TPR) repeat protein
VLIDLTGDKGRDLPYRLVAARRAWEVYERRGGAREAAPRVAKALEDVPVGRWGSPLAIEVIRGLREAGATEDARRLLQALGEQSSGSPEIAVEHALNDLKDGPPERALEPLRGIAGSSETAAFYYAEALFFAGQPDSALAWYTRASRNPSGSFTGAALERIFTIEEGRPKEALPAFGRLAYEQWRNDSRKSLTLADSLYRTLPRASLWAQAAIALAALREKSGDGKGALEPLLALAEGLPNDRLAPLARQRAGDIYRSAYHDDAKAIAQYEECLARYPKAWNAPEVRRRMEALKRDRRF